MTASRAKNWLDPLRRLRQILASALRRRATRTRPQRSAEAFATHMPVLIAWGRAAQARRVLELGCGPHSTGLFLDRRCFPHLEQLVSIEDDPSWYKTVSTNLGADSRLQLRFAREGVPAMVQSLEIGAFDLIFVDDSKTGAERARSIDCVISKLRPGSAVLIHDFEFQPYQEAVARSLPPTHAVFEIDGFNPSCGLVVDKKWSSRSAAMRIKRRLHGMRDRAPPSDIEAWLGLIR